MVTSYDQLIALLDFGMEVGSRHGPTRELLNLQYMAVSSRFVLRRGMNTRLGWAEALQIIAGVFDPEMLKAVAPSANHALFTPSMAYGPRLGFQVDNIIKYLREDPDGLQATLWIARPSDGCTSEQTCTTTGHFLIRGGQLDLTINMRSWDLVKGLPYDLMFFQLLKACVARDLGVRVGALVVQAVSAHYYVEDRAKFKSAGVGEFQFNLAWPDRWPDMREWARHEVAALPDRSGGPIGLVVTKRHGSLEE